MSWESSALQSALTSDSGVVNSVSKFTAEDEVEYPCIFNELIIPENLTQKDYPKTINYYRINPINGGLNYGLINYSIQCRGNTSADAEVIQEAVFSA